MKTKNEHYATNLDDAMQCYYSDKGCFKVPVRMVCVATSETSPDGNPILDGVMLCRDHSATYRPTGKVILDEMVANDSTLEFLRAHDI